MSGFQFIAQSLNSIQASGVTKIDDSAAYEVNLIRPKRRMKTSVERLILEVAHLPKLSRQAVVVAPISLLRVGTSSR